MTDELNHTQQLELHDATGRLIGVFPPDQVIERLITERDSLHKEVARLHAEVMDLQKALAAARKEAQENAAVAAKRAEHLAALLPPPKEVCWTAEDLAEMEANGLSLEELIRDIEEKMRLS